MGYKLWLKVLLFSSFFSFMLIVTFNYYIDSFQLFDKKKNTVSSDLLNGYYISSKIISVNRVENIYESMIKNSKFTDVLAMGSSRTMLLHKELFLTNNINYFNFTDGTAGLKHYVRILGLFNKYKKQIPKKIILGVDPWVFDKKVSLNSVATILKSKQDIESKSKYSQLFNFEYTKINLLSLFKSNTYKKSKNLGSLISGNNMVMSSSGDFYYPIKKNQINSLEISKIVDNNIIKCNKINYNTKCINYKELNNFNEMAYLLDYLEENKIEVTILLFPFEPVFYNHISHNYSFFESNERIINFFKSKKVKIKGSYDPLVFNLNSTDFMDSIHLSESGMKKFLTNLNLITEDKN